MYEYMNVFCHIMKEVLHRSRLKVADFSSSHCADMRRQFRPTLLFCTLLSISHLGYIVSVQYPPPCEPITPGTDTLSPALFSGSQWSHIVCSCGRMHRQQVVMNPRHFALFLLPFGGSRISSGTQPDARSLLPTAT
jgi:hypothetical protein